MTCTEHRFIDEYLSGKSVLQIVKENSGVKYSTVYNTLKRNHIQIRQNDFTAKKYECNSKFFSEISNEHQAYWLGFIYADGFLSKTSYKSNLMGISLSKTDQEHLEKFKKDIEFTGRIHHYTVKSGYKVGTEYSRIIIRDNQICNDLESCGVFHHKTPILKFPSTDIVPQNLVSHFIRGYFDGDGCFTYHINKNGKLLSAVKICGTSEFLLGMAQYLPIRKFPPRLYKRHSADTVSALDVGGNKQSLEIMQYMYSNATIYLSRKYEKFLTFFREYNSRPHR